VLIVVAVLVTFFICWAPFHAQRVLTVSVPDGGWTSTLIEIQSTLFYVSGSLTTSSFLSRVYTSATCCGQQVARNKLLVARNMLPIS